MKKIMLILTVLLIAVFSINPLIILLDTDEVDENYIEKTYGKPIERDLTAERLVRSEFDIFVEFALENASVIEDEEKQLIKKNYNKDEQPIKFIITFPNGQKRVYTVKI